MAAETNAEMMVTSPVLRCAYVFLHTPKIDKDTKESRGYSVTLMIPKSETEIVRKYRQAIVAAIKSKWPDKDNRPPRLKKIEFKTHLSTGDDGWPLKDGDEMKGDEFNDHVCLECKSYDPIPVVGPLRQEITGDDLKRLVSGMHFRVVAKAFPYTKGKGGVSFFAQAVQFCKDDGTRYAGRIDAKKAFDDFDDQEGADDESNYANNSDDEDV